MDKIAAACQAIDSALSDKEYIIIGIDGSAASGKTTLACELKKVYNCSVIHMDHFFLPKELRTPERYSQPGGNIHYERFIKEVVKPLKKGESFSYRIFDCGILDYRGEAPITPRPVVIVEGSYSFHEIWQNMYDIKIMLEIDSALQLERLKKRISEDPRKKENGEEILRRFTDTWIPLEQEYLRQLTIKPDLIL